MEELFNPAAAPRGGARRAGARARSHLGVKVRVLTNSLAATDEAPVHAGVRLYELKPSGERRGGGPSSDASLHAKTFGVDRSRIFVGPKLAAQLSHALDSGLPRDAYEVVLSEGNLQWIEEGAPLDRFAFRPADRVVAVGFWAILLARSARACISSTRRLLATSISSTSRGASRLSFRFRHSHTFEKAPSPLGRRGESGNAGRGLHKD
jgi:hypothetical protein